MKQAVQRVGHLSRKLAAQPSFAAPTRAASVASRLSSATRTVQARPILASRPPARHYATAAASPVGPDAGPSTIPDISAKDTYDIVIIGAANAGLALACALSMSHTLKRRWLR